MANLSISKAWDETKQVVARDGRLLTTVALALFVLPGVITDLVAPPAAPGELPKFGLGTVLMAVMLVIALAGQLAVIRLAGGAGPTVGQAIAHGAQRVPAYLTATLMWVLPFVLVAVLLARSIGARGDDPAPAAALGLMLVAGVMIYLAVRFLMSSAVASNEAAGPVAILRRSWALTSGRWWRLFGFFMIFLIAAVIAVVAVGAVGGIVAKLVFGGVEPGTVGGLLVSLLTQIVSASVSVLLMVMLARIYGQLAGAGAAEASVPTTGS